MLGTFPLGRFLSWLAAIAVALTPAVSAQSEAEESFYRAFYLEEDEGDLANALALYEKVARSRSVEAELRKKAQRRADGIREDLRASDFARLMPHDALFYLELSRPGEQLKRLLDQLGLLHSEDGTDNPPFGVSASVVEGLLGMRGAAVAITGIDPNGGPPRGVVVAHPGDMDLVRGLIETALPVGGRAVDPIEGHPTWSIENHVFVTTTARLVVASTERSEIRGVLSRLAGEGGRSLADNDALEAALSTRGDGLLSFCLNAEPILPMLEGMLQQEMGRNPEMAMVMAMLDIRSLQSVSGHLGVDDDGIAFDIGLQLDEGHRNIVFNLMRSPHVEHDTMKLVPKGAAFFLATAVNPKAPAAPMLTDGRDRPVVTFMDFGRELFSNLVDVAVYGLAPGGGSGSGHSPIPDVALVMRVNDPSRSEALWDFVFGIATQASSQGQARMRSVEIAGDNVREYNIAGVPVYLAIEGDRLILSPSATAITRSMDATSERGSVLKDPVYASSIAAVDEDSTFVLMANPGRCMKMASSFMSERELRELQPFADVMHETVVSVGVEHSATHLAFQARISNIPNVSGLVAEAIVRERGFPYVPAPARPQVADGFHEPAVEAVADTDWDPAEFDAAEANLRAAVETLEDASLAATSGLKALRADFEKLAASSANTKEARVLAEAVIEAAKEDATYLNNFAWALLTEKPYARRFDQLALKASARSNELTDYDEWAFVDTLALAHFENGRAEKAVKLQEKALRLIGDDPRRKEVESALKRFLHATKERKATEILEEEPLER